MKISTGIHPKHRHWGAWVLLVVLAVVVLVLTHRPSGGTAFAGPSVFERVKTPSSGT